MSGVFDLDQAMGDPGFVEGGGEGPRLLEGNEPVVTTVDDEHRRIIGRDMMDG